MTLETKRAQYTAGHRAIIRKMVMMIIVIMNTKPTRKIICNTSKKYFKKYCLPPNLFSPHALSMHNYKSITEKASCKPQCTDN